MQERSRSEGRLRRQKLMFLQKSRSLMQKPRVARDEEKRDGKGERAERSGDPKGTDPMSAMPPLCHLRLVGVKFELCREVDRGAVADDMVIRARSRLRRDPSHPSLRTKTEVLSAMVTSRAQRLTLPA